MKTARIIAISLIMVSGCIKGIDKVKNMRNYPFVRQEGWKTTSYRIDKVIASHVSGEYNQEPCKTNQWLVFVSRSVIPLFLQEKGRVPHAHEYIVAPIVVKEGICRNCTERAQYWKALDWRGPLLLAGLSVVAYKNKDKLKRMYEQTKAYVQKLKTPTKAEKKECSEK